jgi:DNA-binding XRE family transcriptional regulator
MLTQDALAREAHVARDSITSLERGGRARIATIAKLAAVFGLSAAELTR